LSVRGGDPGEGELVALHHAYVRRLPERAAAVALAVEAWRRAPERADLLEAAESLTHRLRGSSGSYGLASFSCAMGVVDDALRRARLGERTRSDDREAMDQALRHVRALAAEAVAGVPSWDERL
jgi:hypothetical protein